MTWVYVVIGIIFILAILYWWDHWEKKQKPSWFRIENEISPGRRELVCYTDNPLGIFQAWIARGLDTSKLFFKRVER